MKPTLHALVISQDNDTLQHIQDAFKAAPDVKLSLQTDWPVAEQYQSPSVLILHSDTPSVWLRKLRAEGYRQPALVLTADTPNPNIEPLEADLGPLENVTWDVMRAGGLRNCVDFLLNAAVV